MSSSTPPSSLVPVQQKQQQPKHRTFDKIPMERLQAEGFPQGLAQSLVETTEAFPLRIRLLDNSGSMLEDGRGIKRSGKGWEPINCSRWEVVQASVEYHAHLARDLNAPTSFHLLTEYTSRHKQKFDVAHDPKTVDQDIENVVSLMSKVVPKGSSPLIERIQDIHKEVTAMVPELKKTGKHVVIVIATDGIPSGGRDRFIETLQDLAENPVWTVIHLCTDDKKVVDFYNDLDSSLELPLEVLCDFFTEADEVHRHNPWINYTLPLHRCREMGYHDRVFDLIDERPLEMDEVRDFCALLFGSERFEYKLVPDPNSDWKIFAKAVQRVVDNEPNQWNPKAKKETPLIDMKKLHEIYADSKSCFAR